MTEKNYVVLPGQVYVGKHKSYKEGSKVPESELFGDLETALKGQKEEKSKEGLILKRAKKAKLREVEDSKGKVADK